LTATDGIWWYLNLVDTGVLQIPKGCFIVVWMSEGCRPILIGDNGNELHYCPQAQKNTA